MTSLDVLQKLRVMKELHSLQNRTYDLACLQFEGTLETDKLIEASFQEVDNTYRNIQQIIRGI